MRDPDANESLARAFVARRGTPLERLRGSVGVGVETPERLLDALRAVQDPRGAFSFPDTEPHGPVAGALRGLAILRGAGLLGSDVAARAVSWLGGMRDREGAWSIPRGGEHAGHLATAFLAGFLAESPFARIEWLDAAGNWLAGRFRPELVQSGDFAMIASHTHFFANAPHESSDAILQWCGRELERGVRGGRLPALFALRVFSLAGAPVLPGARVVAGDLLASLAEGQDEDGGWLPGCPDGWRVEATLEALAQRRRF